MERQIRIQYTADDKAQAVSLAETLGPTKAARKLEIPVKTLTNGIRISREGSGFVNDGKRRPVSELGAENARLRAENQKLHRKAGLYQKSRCVLREAVPVKSASIASERTHSPIGFMGRGLDVSTSGFFAGQARQRALAVTWTLRCGRRSYGSARRAGARAAGVSPPPCGPRAGASTPSAPGA